jgi:hypothetical protein
MNAQLTTRYAVCLGLAGSLAVAIAPAVQAQIQVTGGRVSGQAGFFVPTPGTGNRTGVELFDLSVQRLRLETPNGNTSTAVFTPTAANFKAGSDNQPNQGDKGTLQGVLSGIAFSASGGTPVPFRNRDTVLNFTLTSFNSNLGVINGTLISPQKPGDAPLVFLPNVNATLAPGSSYQTTRGDLELGDFRADINTGLIDLPSNLVFRDFACNVCDVPPVSLTPRVKFEFEGENVRPQEGTNFDINRNDTGTIRFVGEVNKKFLIETVNNSDSDRERFKLEGTFGAVDIQMRGPFDLQNRDRLNEDRRIDKYKIEGESNGFGTLFANNAVGFNGTSRRDVKFSFEQDGDKLEGTSNGDVNFYAVLGARQFNRDVQFKDYTVPPSGNGSNRTVSMCTTCGTTLSDDSTITVGNTNVTVGSPIVINVDNSTNSTTVNNTVNITYTFANAFNLNVSSLASLSNSSTAVTQYQVFTAGNGNSVSPVRNQVRLVQRGGDRYYVVSRVGGGSNITTDDDDRDDDNNRNNRDRGRDNDNNGNNRNQGRDDDNNGNNRNQGRDDDNGNNRNQGRDDDNNGNNRNQGRDDDNNGNNRDDDDNRDDDRASDNSDQTAYKLVGPSSRCFPGLVGLRQIPPDQVADLDKEDTQVANTDNGNRQTANTDNQDTQAVNTDNGNRQTANTDNQDTQAANTDNGNRQTANTGNQDTQAVNTDNGNRELTTTTTSNVNNGTTASSAQVNN